MASSSDVRPSFFKIMHGYLNSERVIIPKAFVKHISKDLGDVVTLKSPSGECKQVKLNRYDGRIYLHEGWQEFAKDQSLGDSEFIIFRYDGDLCFEVQIFEKTGLKRYETPILDQGLQLVVTKEKRERGRPKKIISAKDVCISEVITIDDPKKIKEVKDAPAEEMKAYTTRGFKLRNQVESFTSKYPHAMVRIGKATIESATAVLVLPKAFSRAHLPLRKSKAILKNLEGKVWEVTSVFAKNNRTHSLARGWIQFARANNVTVGDTCVFELVAEREMLVRIFPQR